MTAFRTAIVTGSTGGIGLAVARAECGHSVMMNGLGDPTEIEATRAAIAADTGAPLAPAMC